MDKEYRLTKLMAELGLIDSDQMAYDVVYSPEDVMRMFGLVFDEAYALGRVDGYTEGYQANF